jgi:hypothetical protein
MVRTWEDVDRYSPVLVREDVRERAEREIARLEAEADRED